MSGNSGKNDCNINCCVTFAKHHTFRNCIDGEENDHDDNFKAVSFAASRRGNITHSL